MIFSSVFAIEAFPEKPIAGVHRPARNGEIAIVAFATIWPPPPMKTLRIPKRGLCSAALHAPKILVLFSFSSTVEHVVAAIATMEAAGYENRGNRYEVDVYAFMKRSTVPQRRVYLLPRGNETHERRIVFRDYLIAHPEIAADYSALKHRLAQEYAYDGDGYTRAKTDFVNGVIARGSRHSMNICPNRRSGRPTL